MTEGNELLYSPISDFEPSEFLYTSLVLVAEVRLGRTSASFPTGRLSDTYSAYAYRAAYPLGQTALLPGAQTFRA